MNISDDRYKNIINFVLNERFLTITVIGSIVTFSLISNLKADIFDPLLHFIFPEENFGFMDITIRDGEGIPMPTPKRIDLKFGNFFRELMLWLFFMGILFLMAKYTRFPDHPQGNIMGAAVM